MNELQQMMARLAPVAGLLQVNVGDAFNLQNLASLFVQAEKIDGLSPQMALMMDYARFIPANTNINAVYGTSTILQRKQGVGVGRAFSGTGMDIPLAEVVYDEVSLKTKLGAVGYQYALEEIKTAAMMGIRLESDKVAAARLAFEKHMSRVAWFGEAETGLKGFYNQDGVALTAKTIDFATASVQQLLEFFNGVIFDAIDATEHDSSIAPTDIILPMSVAKILSSRITTDVNPVPVMDYIHKNNEAALEGKSINITSSKRGDGMGQDGAGRIVAYCKDPNCLEMRIPRDLTFETAQQTGFDVFVPGSYLYQGLWLKRVDSMRYVDVKKA